ncbi:MAG: acylphosphatase [Candidatus Omnitrophica bacterium]|nr:acylphosphatase [Candidatus Omnitrophota bacterium]MDD5355706.1 acylphosphatase [Candidatus Omnitrophota bacterium]
MSKVQAHVIFKGRVQGIGFRFTAERIAQKTGVVGWVKNLPGGDVELVVEADKKTVDDFLDKIRNQFSNYIQDEEIETTTAIGKLDNFQIRF